MLKIKLNKGELCYFSNHQKTPLHGASVLGYLNVAKYLIEKGAEVNVKDWIR